MLRLVPKIYHRFPFYWEKLNPKIIMKLVQTQDWTCEPFCQDIKHILLHGYVVSWSMLLLSTTRKGRETNRCFHNSSHDSQANMSLTDGLFLLLLLFVLILKAWHWQINNLFLGFQMSQQSLSSHADVSAGSDVCNLIGAQRERNSGLWPLARLCILSSLVRRDAEQQSLNAARPPGHLSAVAAVLSVHPRDTAQTSPKICPCD